MKKFLPILLCLMLAATGHAQVNVSLSPVARQTFVDLSGSPCAGCKLHTYLAGTTTPSPTYTDSLGISQNTNPIILDVAGGANIWLNNTLKYKFALLDAMGSTIWTVDNVSGSGSGGVPCSTPFAIQYSNSTASALSCDPTIKIDPNIHAIQVNGVISGPYFSLHPVNTITSSWTFDVTSPSAALTSLGTVPYIQFPSQGADSLVMNAMGASATPTAVALPTGCLFGINYDTGAHVWSCVSAGGVPLSSLAVQAADTVVMNATAGSASPTAVGMPAGCTQGVNYSTSTHSWTCSVLSFGGIANCLTTACAGGTTYAQGISYVNGLLVPVTEMVTATLTGTSGTGGQYQIGSVLGGVAGPAQEVANECSNNPGASITLRVPPGGAFQVNLAVPSGCSPAGTWSITSWLESQ